MKIEKIKTKIVCDVSGCGNLAVYQIKHGESESNCYSLNVCSDCASKMHKAFSGILGVKHSGKNKL